MLKSNNTNRSKSSPKRGLARARVPKLDELDKMLRDGKCLELAVSTLIAMCHATVEHWDKKQEKMVIEVDGLTRVKAAQLLLAYGKGEPVKRQQILTGKMPTTTPSREELMQAIDRKIAALLSQDDVTLQQLVAAKKVMTDSDTGEPTEKLSEEEIVAKAREIHGIV